MATPEGALELRQRGERDFLITIAGRVLMTSSAHHSEDELARLACAALAAPQPRVLLGGLGMGYTLRAALDVLAPRAALRVCELNPDVAAWCRGPLAALTGRALDDPRVTLELGDVAHAIARAAPAALDAIILDLYEGPHDSHDGDPLYGTRALAAARAALAPGGVYAVWSEDPDPAYESRARRAGFQLERRRPATGARRHVIYLAR